MSESEKSPVFLFDNSDPEMQEAYQKARATFGFFWREVAWEKRRIVPALELASVKAPFFDGPGDSDSDSEGDPDVEHMWLNEIDFDGQVVTGVLLNSPNVLQSVKAGDSVRLRLDEITDWMYSIGGEVYGAYTVNLMRSRMTPAERKDHDDAWDLNFGDPHKIRLFPTPQKPAGFLRSLIGRGGRSEAEIPEHPMSESMAQSLKNRLKEDPSQLHATDDRGWTLLHQEALAGSAPTVQVLLERGADPNAATKDGTTPVQLARSLGWDKVVAILVAKGAR